MVRLTYRNLSQKHLVAGNSREEEELFCVIVKSVLRLRECP
jgi:hypothetical protein